MGVQTAIKMLQQVKAVSTKSMSGLLPNGQTSPANMVDPDLMSKMNEGGGYRDLFSSVKSNANTLQDAQATERASMPKPSESASAPQIATFGDDSDGFSGLDDGWSDDEEPGEPDSLVKAVEAMGDDEADSLVTILTQGASSPDDMEKLMDVLTKVYGL